MTVINCIVHVKVIANDERNARKMLEEIIENPSCEIRQITTFKGDYTTVKFMPKRYRE